MGSVLSAYSEASMYPHLSYCRKQGTGYHILEREKLGRRLKLETLV